MIGNLSIDNNSIIKFCEQFNYKTNLTPSSDTKILINSIEPIELASKNSLSFCRFDDERAKKWIQESTAEILILPNSLMESDFLKNSSTYIFAEIPRLALLNLINLFWTSPSSDGYLEGNPSIHPTAIIGDNVTIGMFSVIGPYVEIGNNTIIGNNTSIKNTVIGINCKIGNSVSIGEDGFGFEDLEETNEIISFPHIGGVKIGNDVRIGSSTCIDRGSIGDTIIKDKVKIDNLVHVAHNVIIDDGAKIVAMTIIGGSTKIGSKTWVAPGTSLRDWITIGKNSLIGLGAVVTKNVDDETSVIGNPAKPIIKTNKRYR